MNRRVCFSCGSTTTYIQKKGTPSWYNINGKPHCSKCYNKVTHDPIYNKAKLKKWGKKRLTFKDKRLNLDQEPRTGECKICNKKIGDEYINSKGNIAIVKQTQLHHFAEYHDDDPLKNTIELCASCHAYETWKHRKGDPLLNNI